MITGSGETLTECLEKEIKESPWESWELFPPPSLDLAIPWKLRTFDVFELIFFPLSILSL